SPNCRLLVPRGGHRTLPVQPFFPGFNSAGTWLFLLSADSALFSLPFFLSPSFPPFGECGPPAPFVMPPSPWAKASLNPLRHRDVKAVDLSYAAPTFGSNGFTALQEWVGVPLVSDVLDRFGKRLRGVRQQVGVSQETLAEMAELHRTYVSSVERG